MVGHLTDQTNAGGADRKNCIRAAQCAPSPHDAGVFGSLARRSEIDHDPTWPFTLEMRRFSIPEIEDGLVGIARDWRGKMPNKAFAGCL